MPKRVKNAGSGVCLLQTTGFQSLALLVILTIINMTYFLSQGLPFQRAQCSTDLILRALAGYISNKGEMPLETCIPDHCNSPEPDTIRAFSAVVRGVLGECRKNYTQQHYTQRTNAILTLVTTFADHQHKDNEKYTVHNNTIVNWAKLRPRVNLLLFSDNKELTILAKKNGWDVIASTDKNNTQPPVLKDMFIIAKSRYTTNWYGYVNADILFTSDLILHLDYLDTLFNATDKRMLLIGKRTNVDHIAELNARSDASIINVAKRGTLFGEDAEDFFIATKAFPWQRILPVVVGRPAYDNWLVGEVRCHMNTDVIDVSETLLALHQTTDKGGNSEGHNHPEPDINLNIFKANSVTPNFLAGLTTCAPYNTFYTLCDTLAIHTRTKLGEQCTCKS